MLVNSKSDCCCPEMRCCTPTTIVATIGGMAGQTMRGPSHVRPGARFGQKPGIGTEFYECYVCNDSLFLHSIVDAMAHMGQPTGRIGDMVGLYEQFEGAWCYNGDGGNPWPPSAFPPASPMVTIPDCEPFDMYGEPQSCEDVFGNVGYYGQLADVVIGRWIVNNAISDPAQGGHATFVSRPEPDGLHSGPCVGPGQWIISNENDLNGTFVLSRPATYVRPQLRAHIARQTPLSDSPYRGATEAELLYNVDPRRTWVFRPPPFECWDIMFPAEGDDYCVDYRCGKRNPWYSANGFGICVRGKCTTTNQGVVKPHLYYYHEGLAGATSAEQVLQMQSANLYLRLVPRDYETDIHGRFPTWWRVSAVDVRGSGYGYSVGDFLQVDFDIRRPWLGGEIMTVFPKFDMSCAIPFAPSWADIYGYSGTEVTLASGIAAQRLYQRLRVAEVDANGGIVAVEVLPIRKTPDFKDPPACNQTWNPPRDYWVGYGRVLCHPRSVQFPGIGYSIGDQITFTCDSPACTTIAPASATVTDVDDEGGILDWRIRGSDFPFGYATAYSCDETDGNGTCIASCFDRMPGSEPDQRGSYKWNATVLCELVWTGITGPVRGASVASTIEVPCTLGMPTSEFAQNNSGFTPLTVRINRVASETSIEIFVYPYPYDALAGAGGGADYARYLFPAFPRCAGGGAVIRPLFGEAGANESDFGSLLAGGVVEAHGGGYCFRDRYHVEPTLPNAVPSIGNGAGATIAEFAFSAVNDFPNPALDYGGPTIASNRFSYFPVTGATIASPGSGYEVGQEFDVFPAGGRAVTDMWSATGGDLPEECPNGAWYEGARATVNSAGYLSLIYDNTTGSYGEATFARAGKARLRVASVSETGGIESLEVVHGGMMFRAAYGLGRRNPSAAPIINSTLGYGAYVEAAFDEDHTSATFGQLLSVAIVGPPGGVGDPKHPGSAIPTGGRDYADPSAGYFWMLADIGVGDPVCPPWSLLAHLDWGGRRAGDQPMTEPEAPRNWFHEDRSTHTVVDGFMPAFQPRSTLCSFNDCYHDLLARTYPLCKTWSCGCVSNGADSIGPPWGEDGDGSPATGYALLKRKGSGSPGAGSDYYVIEHGPTITLAHTLPSPCPDHMSGTPQRE